MASEDKLVAQAVVGIAAGIYFFWDGFRKLKLKKTVEAIATSKVRSVAMGTVELAGIARPAAQVLDPIFQQPCVLYRVVVKEHRKSGKNSKWVTIYQSDSFAHPFWLEDDTGKIMVFPHACDPHLKEDVNEEAGGLFAGLSNSSEPVQSFARSLNRGMARLKVEANIVREHEPVYVLGYAAPSRDPYTFREKVAQKTGIDLTQIARLLKSNSEKMKALDKNGDGSVDAQEWTEGLDRFRKEVEAAEAKPEPEPPTPERELIRVLIRKSPEGLLVISDGSEDELVSSLGTWAALEVFGGALLSLGCAAYLLHYFGYLA